MAVFVDLDDDDCASDSRSCDHEGSTRPPIPVSASYGLLEAQARVEGRASPDDGSGMMKNVSAESSSIDKLAAAALTCYPYAL